MTREKIIELARSVGLFQVSYPHPGNMEEVIDFYNAARNEALEEAAKLVENIADTCGSYYVPRFKEIADKIRNGELKNDSQ